VEEAVTPLAKISIAVQLQKKNQLALTVLDAMRQEITNANPAANTWFLFQENKFKTILDLKKIVPSPVTDGYRNKCEFVIGSDFYKVTSSIKAKKLNNVPHRLKRFKL
jgi:tRNA (uracil-5-)-methyltransferase